MTDRVLFINRDIKECGVHQYGYNLCTILIKYGLNMIYCEVDNQNTYTTIMNKHSDISIVIYNYHSSTMPWLTRCFVRRRKNIGVLHESRCNLFDIIIDIDPTGVKTATNIPIPRPIDYETSIMMSSNNEIANFINYKEDGVPVFGSFGLCLPGKGFENVVSFVNNNYDKAIIKLLTPSAHFNGNRRDLELSIKNECIKRNVKSNVKLMIYDKFVSNDDIKLFLQSNTLNLFLYDKFMGRGISSVIDVVLSANVPFGISDSYMFRHVYDDGICVYKTRVEDCIENSKVICKKYRELYHPNKLVSIFKDLCV